MMINKRFKRILCKSVSFFYFSRSALKLANISLLLTCFLTSITVLAQTYEYGEYDYSTMIENYTADDITAQFVPLTTGLMGERHDINTGALSFRHVDVSIPGNSHLPVEFARTYSSSKVEVSILNPPALGSWEVDVPYILMRVVSGQSTSVDFCNSLDDVLNMHSVDANNFIGIKLNIPGQGRKSLGNEVTSSPIFAGDVKFNTTDFWVVKCGVSLQGASGKGFTAVAPNGDTYVLNKILSRYAGKFQNTLNESTDYDNFYFMVTQVTDVNGNWVKYEYNDYGVTKIHSNDLRQIDVTYEDTFIETVFANGRTWQYDYVNNQSLTKVTLPDSTYWDIATQGTEAEGFCHFRYLFDTPVTYSTSMKHPNGTQAVFDRQVVSHLVAGRIYTSSYLDNPGQGPINNAVRFDTPCSFGFPYNRQFFSLSLTQKTIVKPDGSELVWTYDYHELPAGWVQDDEINEVTGTYTTRYTFNISGEPIPEVTKRTVVDPEGHKTITYINNVQYDGKAGTVSKVETYDSASSNTPLRTQYFDEYAAVNNYFTPYGVKYVEPSQRSETVPSTVRIVQNGNSYTTATTYDTDTTSTTYSYGFPIQQTTSSSTHSKVRTYKTVYAHNLDKWILGLVDNTSLNNTLINEYDYDNLGRVETEKLFGRERATYTYHTNSAYVGAVKSITNANNEKVELLNWKRGTPQQIKRPDGLSSYRYVDNNGWTTQTVDFKDNCIDYEHNDVGWLTLIDPCDSRWSNTHIAYAFTSSDEGLTGVSSDMLKQTTTRGNYEKVTYLDHFYQPALVQERDKSDSTTQRYIRTSFNSDGAVTYQSKPDDSDTTPYGVSTTYDSLGRVKSVNDNTLSGSISYSYLSGNKVRVNDNRGYETTTTYQSYGAPDQSAATKISSPEGVTTDFSYDIYGKVTAITQGGITEHRVYNNYQQLCKTVRPDTGRVAYGYNAIGQMVWSATGSSVASSTTSCDNTVNASAKISYDYKNTGLLESVDYGDSSPDKVFEYDENNNLTKVTAGSVENTYAYNSINLVTSEQLLIDGKTLSVSHGYNSRGELASTTYPDSLHITFSPNALGQHTKAGNYADDAEYHPNGVLKTFVYGNGFVHTSELYNSGLPKSIADINGGVTAIDYHATYDSNANLTYLRDDQNALYNLDLGYDGLNRLVDIHDSFLGSGSYNYDGMGNITSYQLGSRSLSYSYNANKRLTSTSGYKNYSFSYDDRGNVTHNGVRGFTFNLAQHVTYSNQSAANVSFTYDGQDKRVKKVINGQTSYFMYGLNGKLLYQENPSGGAVSHIYLANRPVAKVGDASPIGRMHYEPYGQPEDTSALNNEASYTGHVYDDDMDLVYMQARYYDPVIGRFYSNDPVDALGHLSGGNIQGFNRYAYANNNPYKYVDPDGEAPIVPILIAGGRACASNAACRGAVVKGAKQVSKGARKVANAVSNLLGAVLNESASTDVEIEGLTDGLESETDARGRPRDGQFVNPDGTAQDALDSLSGESDGNGGKILEDGSRAGTHTSTGTSGGQTGENSGSQTLHINRPKGKQNVKIRFPNDKQEQ